MAVNMEQAALKALEKLKSMPIENLVEKVLSNVQDPLAITIRELSYLNEKEPQFTTALMENALPDILKELSLMSKKMEHLERKMNERNEQIDFLINFILVAFAKKSSHSGKSSTINQNLLYFNEEYISSNRMKITGIY